ncbi:unnamed protein product [Rangifer tarandus platyrhynchus]|uniref:Uncharacterized protein n=1 Tax=Rangifer tarandus platyrhynchus TaxID=3082113 RepID=A0ABN8ZGQ8_RANTA|nr:unnamed protein product [Rangifer tarandus platyrhynchus]
MGTICPAVESLNAMSNVCHTAMSDSCDPTNCSPPGSSVHGISQARILEWVAILMQAHLPDPGIKPSSPVSPALAGRFFPISTTKKKNGCFKAHKWAQISKG